MQRWRTRRHSSDFGQSVLKTAGSKSACRPIPNIPCDSKRTQSARPAKLILQVHPVSGSPQPSEARQTLPPQRLDIISMHSSMSSLPQTFDGKRETATRSATNVLPMSTKGPCCRCATEHRECTRADEKVSDNGTTGHLISPTPLPLSGRFHTGCPILCETVTASVYLPVWAKRSSLRALPALLPTQ